MDRSSFNDWTIFQTHLHELIFINRSSFTDWIIFQIDLPDWSSPTAPHSLTKQSSITNRSSWADLHGPLLIQWLNNLPDSSSFTHRTIYIHPLTEQSPSTHPLTDWFSPTHRTIYIHPLTEQFPPTHPHTHRFLSPTTLPWRYAISNLMWLTQICIQDLDSVAWARCHCCSDSSMPTALQGSNIFPAKFSISCTFFFFFFYFFNFMYFVIFFAKFEISCNS